MTSLKSCCLKSTKYAWWKLRRLRRYWRKEWAASKLQVKAPSLVPPAPPLRLHTQTKAKAVTFPQARGPSPFVRQHVESAGAECIFVCCFITCSCFIDGDLKAPKYPTVRLWWREVELGERAATLSERIGGGMKFQGADCKVCLQVLWL